MRSRFSVSADEHEVGVAARADQREGLQQVVGAKSSQAARNSRLSCARRSASQPAPRRIDLQEGVLDEVALGHGVEASIRIVACCAVPALRAPWRSCSRSRLAAAAAARRPSRGPGRGARSWPSGRSGGGARRRRPTRDETPSILDRLDERRSCRSGSSGATQGAYGADAGAARHHRGHAHVDRPPTSPKRPPELTFYAEGGGRCSRAGSTRARAPRPRRPTSCPACSAQTIPGGAAYAGVRGRSQLEAVAAADRDRAHPASSRSARPPTSRGARSDLLARPPPRRRRAADRRPGGEALDELLAERGARTSC